MAIPPAVSAADACEAAERIRARRVQIDDPNLWRWSDELVDVLAYLRRYSRGVPRWVAEADVLDGLTVRLGLWWLGEEAELWLLESAHRLGVGPRRVGSVLGVGSRQGVHDRLRLARAKVAKLRGAPEPAAAPATGAADAVASWIREHRAELLTIGSEAVAHRDLGDDEAAEWLVDVARDTRDRVTTAGSVATLRVALAELAVSDGVRAAPAGHPVHGLLRRWATLDNTLPRG